MLTRKEVAEILLQQYRGSFRFSQPANRRTRMADLSSMQHIKPLGSYLHLAGYARLVDQVLQALWDLEAGFTPGDNFVRGLQLLRLAAAPGMGKVSTAHRPAP